MASSALRFGASVFPFRDLDTSAVPSPFDILHHAEPVAMRMQPHGLVSIATESV